MTNTKKLISFVMSAIMVLAMWTPIESKAAESLSVFGITIDNNIAGKKVSDYKDFITMWDSVTYFEAAGSDMVAVAINITDGKQAITFEEGKEYKIFVNLTANEAENYVMPAVGNSVQCTINDGTPQNVTVEEFTEGTDTFSYITVEYTFTVPVRVLVDSVSIDIDTENIDGVNASDYNTFITLNTTGVKYKDVSGDPPVGIYNKNTGEEATLIEYSEEYEVIMDLMPKPGYKFPEVGATVACAVNGKNVNGTIISEGILSIEFDFKTLESVCRVDFEYSNYEKGKEVTELQVNTTDSGITVEQTFLANFDGIAILNGTIAEGTDYKILFSFKADSGYTIKELQKEGIRVAGQKVDYYEYDSVNSQGIIMYSLPTLVHKHSGGTATCKDKAICDSCPFNTEYGELDPNNHVGDTEIRDAKVATCKEEGYTGDTYCLDCNTKIQSGSVIGKTTNHTYDAGVVTKQPTTQAEGIKTFTCSVCLGTKTETISKLPAPPKQEEPKKEPPKQEEVKKAPIKGTELTDKKSKAKYKVTKSALKGGTVTYVNPKNKKVTKVVIPATITIDGIKYKVTGISANAFKGCKKLTTLTIGTNVASVGKSAFEGCKKLKNITIKTTKLKSSKVGAKAFKNVPKNAVVKVSAKKLKAYKKFIYKKGLNKKATIKKIG